jgi:hypothetical protein
LPFLVLPVNERPGFYRKQARPRFRHRNRNCCCRSSGRNSTQRIAFAYSKSV